MAKKATVKAAEAVVEKTVQDTTSEKIEKIEQSLEEGTTESVVESSEIKIDIDTIEKAIESVDTQIKVDTESKDIEKEMEEALKPIKDIADKIQEINESEKALNDVITNNPEKAEEFIKEELKKAETLKASVEKIIKSTSNKKGPSSFSGWWNGAGFDM